MNEPDVLECEAFAVPQEIARLQAVIHNLEENNATLVAETMRIGRLLQQMQTRAERYGRDVERRVADIADLRRANARLATERDALAAQLVEQQQATSA